jgi:hypothetical protein
MFAFFLISACPLWENPELLTYLGWDRHVMIIDTIVFLYATVMIHLLLIKCRKNKRMQQEFACKGIVTTATSPLVRAQLVLHFIYTWLVLIYINSCMQLTSVLMLVATGIMLVALGVMVFVFHPEQLALAAVALIVLFSTAMMFFLLKAGEIERKISPTAKREDASNQV